MGILEAAYFVIIYSTNILEAYTPGKFIFVHDMILLLKHNSDRRVNTSEKYVTS